MSQVSVVLLITYLFFVGTGLFVARSILYDTAATLFMGVLAWLNTDAADLRSVYVPIYHDPGTYLGSTDYGWIVLCQLGNIVGLSYNGFAFVVTIVAMSLVVWFARRATPSSSFFLSLFLIYPGLLSLVQFRQFVACAIGLVAVVFLADGKMKGLVAFLVLVTIAFSVHRSAFVLVALALLPLFRKMQQLERMLLGVFCVAMLGLGIVYAQSLASLVFGEFRTSVYLGVTEGGSLKNSLGGGLRNALYIVVLAVLVPVCSRLLTSEDACELRKRIIGFSGVANIMAATLLPFVFVTNDFMRFERYGFVLALAAFSCMPALNRRHIVLSCKACILMAPLAFGYSYIMKGDYETVIVPLLSYEFMPSFFQ